LKLKIYSKINPVIFLIIGLFFFSCSSDETEIPEEEIVAKVGDRIITKDFFKSSYEFSLSTLRLGENPRRTYLNHMINELLIANEGYTQGFVKNRYVTTRVKNRTNNLLLESFYTKNVYNKVNIPDDKIVDVLKKSTIKFRLLIWPTPSLEKAAEAYDAANESSLEEFIDKVISKLEVRNVDRKNFETDWMDYLEIRPDIFAEILTLVQTGKSRKIPIILMGSDFWRGLIDWFKEQMVSAGTISADDMDLIQIIDEPKAVVDAIFAHYETRSILPSEDEEEIMLEL